MPAGRGASVVSGAIPLALGVAASMATALGGYLALRVERQLYLVMGLSAGIVLGVAAFELVPEALHLWSAIERRDIAFGLIAAGFIFLFTLNRALAISGARIGRLKPHLAPASLTLHSIADGFGMTLAFQMSPEIGWSVAIAVLSHDVADGINIISTTLAVAGRRSARLWLLLNGTAPLIGVMLAFLIAIPPTIVMVVLAGLAGAFLYIGTFELLPRSYRANRHLGSLAAFVTGFALIYGISILQ